MLQKLHRIVVIWHEKNEIFKHLRILVRPLTKINDDDGEIILVISTTSIIKLTNIFTICGKEASSNGQLTRIYEIYSSSLIRPYVPMYIQLEKYRPQTDPL